MIHNQSMSTIHSARKYLYNDIQYDFAFDIIFEVFKTNRNVRILNLDFPFPTQIDCILIYNLRFLFKLIQMLSNYRGLQEI